jgi:cytochrome c oxidase subunit 2
MFEHAVAGASGPAAADIRSLTWVLVVLGTAVFVVFVVLFSRALLRRRDGDDDEAGSRLIFWGGLVVPSVVVAIVLGFTLASMRNLAVEADSGGVVIEVTGHQWWWEVHYPDYDILTANEIHMPVDRRVTLRLTSADVVHSFWVPALAGKLDLLPERVNEMILEASEPDIYRGVCAEFCGLQHAKMAFHVVAVTEPEFQDWVERSSAEAARPKTEAAVRGMDVFFEAGCQQCHTIEGTPADGDVGPDLTRVASRQSLAAGTLDNTTANLELWVTSPQTLKEGVEMPDIELDADDIEALVAYLETLE